MPLTRRYTPEHPPGSVEAFGYDFSSILPKGVVIASGALSIWTNVVVPAPADADWTNSNLGGAPVYIRGRAVYAVLTGGKTGQDYQLVWTAHDNRGGVWNRVGLILCSETS